MIQFIQHQLYKDCFFVKVDINAAPICIKKKRKKKIKTATENDDMKLLGTDWQSAETLEGQNKALVSYDKKHISGVGWIKVKQLLAVALYLPDNLLHH